MPDRDPDCIFCRIVADELPATFVHRGATASAFMDINPVTAGHLLVIPNLHHARLSDTPVETWAHVMRIARRLAAAVSASDPRVEGMNLFVADGETAGQEVPHLHVHVIPRSSGDGFRIVAEAHDKPAPPRDDLERRAAAIRAALGGER